jgi:hypothetical protein
MSDITLQHWYKIYLYHCKENSVKPLTEEQCEQYYKKKITPARIVINQLKKGGD